MAAITNFVDKCGSTLYLDRICEGVGNFLDQNPLIFKVTVLAAHVLRTAMMTLIMGSVTPAAMIGCSLFYAFAIERCFSREKNCAFTFTLPSLFGAYAYNNAKAVLPDIISRVAFATADSMLKTAIGTVPLAAWAIYVILQTNSQVNAKIEANEES